MSTIVSDYGAIRPSRTTTWLLQLSRVCGTLSRARSRSKARASRRSYDTKIYSPSTYCLKQRSRDLIGIIMQTKTKAWRLRWTLAVASVTKTLRVCNTLTIRQEIAWSQGDRIWARSQLVCSLAGCMSECSISMMVLLRVKAKSGLCEQRFGRPWEDKKLSARLSRLLVKH